ncbi:MAG: flavodoxin family protein [Peptostreptococcaceae bacterium]|nr:flavodoxin family protein [Peptostreptococcaceae bacterium]
MLILTDKTIDLKIKQAEIININSHTINFCTSCFNCWIKTPGSCVIRDDQVHIYPKIAIANEIVYICKVRYGCYDVAFKTMLERCLPLQQPFLRILKNETHHEQRGVEVKDAIIIGYGVENEEEKGIFTKLIERNSFDMCLGSYKVIFATETEVEEILLKEVSERWIKQ